MSNVVTPVISEVTTMSDQKRYDCDYFTMLAFVESFFGRDSCTEQIRPRVSQL